MKLAPTRKTTLKAEAQLELNFRNLRSDEGLLFVALFGRAAGFPDQHTLATQWLTVPIRQQVAQVLFGPIAPGRYAWCYYHDENLNQRLDKNLLGQPTEDYGFSNGVKGLFRVPTFAECAFTLGPGPTQQTVWVQRCKPLLAK
jgi:uncharacterized protein (DUF2141 family)